MPVPAQNSARARVKADYISLEGKGGYRALGALWGVSTGVAWKLANIENYWPKDPGIRKILKEKARDLGIEIVKKRRKIVFYL